jgi:ubiquinone/menaquinone biosynthesis C-methylase UbiE
MDALEQDPAQLDVSLADLRAVNRWLGGTRTVMRHLRPMVRRLGRPSVRILDVATGSADIPLAVSAWARRAGIAAQIVATDNHPTTLRLAAEAVAHDPSIRVEPADALHLPYADDAFDFALCSTALHHFDEREDAVRVLRELDRVAAHGVIVNDLARSRPAYLGARLLALTFWRTHPVTRHDGPLSVLRALTPGEMRALARDAGLAAARVHAHFPFRLALVIDRTRTGR